MNITNKPQTGREYVQNDLFRGGDEVSLNACVGRNGGPYGLDAYATGYFRAAAAIIRHLEEESTFVDSLIYPLVFVYRHAIELSLKHLSMVLPRLWDEHGNPAFSHKLMDNWAIVKEYLSRDNAFDSDSTLIPQVERVLRDFVEIDPKGEAFRFPHGREGPFLIDTRLINVVVFEEAMGLVKQAFEYWGYVAGSISDQIE